MNQEKKDLLCFALVVVLATTLIIACFPPFHVTSNWAANLLMFVPGLVAAAILLRRREGFRSIGWGIGPGRYWIAATLLPTVAILIAVAASLRLGYAAPAPLSTPAGSLVVHPVKLLKYMVIYLVISLRLAFGEEFRVARLCAATADTTVRTDCWSARTWHYLGCVALANLPRYARVSRTSFLRPFRNDPDR